MSPNESPSMPASGMSAEPVAWRVRVYEGGWINARSLGEAQQLALTPNRIQSLYAIPPDCVERIDSLTQELAAKDKEIAGMKAERDEAMNRAEELEAYGEQVSVEFEKDCWQALRSLLNECKFDWRDADMDGVQAQQAREYISQSLSAMEETEAKARARAESAEAQLTALRSLVTEAAERDVLTERKRQIEAEGWSASHDDEHSAGEMGYAAMAYIANSAVAAQMLLAGMSPERVADRAASCPVTDLWPWDSKWWKPSGQRRDLVNAGALILAEIERLDRASDRLNEAVKP